MRERMAATVIIVFLAVACAVAQGTGQLAGTVRDADGLPMPGILVEVSSPALAETVRPVATDARGRYRFAGLPPGVYSITFRLIGFWAERRELQLPSGYRMPFNVRLYGNGELEPLPDAAGGASLRGTVLDPMQGVMPGVTLNLSGPATRTTTSDSRGEFSFTNLPAGDYQLRAALEAFGTTVRRVALAAGTTRTLRVEMSVAAIFLPAIETAESTSTIDTKLTK